MNSLGSETIRFALHGRMLQALLVGASISLNQCGYSPAYAGARPSAQLTVSAAPSLVPESGAASALLNGVRQELSRAGALRPGAGYPRAVVQLLRVDEFASGIAVQPGQPWATPLARGSVVGVMARAWVEEAPGSPAYRDTGDVRRVSTVSVGTSLVVDAASHDAAIESAGLRTGQALARRLLGEVEPGVEPL